MVLRNDRSRRNAIACVLVSCFRSLRASCQGTMTILCAAGAGSLYRGEIGRAGTTLGTWPKMSAERPKARPSKLSVHVLVLPRGLGPWAGALVSHGHQIVQAWTSHGVQEALTFHAAKGKSLTPD